MPAITFDKFDGGLDLRKAADVAEANRLRILRNAYITTGKEIKKRPGLTKVAELEAGTKGLQAFAGKLNTFTATYGLTHANALFEARFTPHDTQSARTVAKCHYADMFLGFPYCVIEYDDGSVQHHYLDEATAWEATKAYSFGNIVQPTTANGFFYRCTTAGTSGGSQPTWPTTIGQTVNDGTVVWTTVSRWIRSTGCPNTKSVCKQKEKIFAIDGDTVAYCATGDARDWSSTADAGFLATGIQQTGSTDALAVAEYQDKLAVFFVDGAQVWDTDPDPAKIVLNQRIFNLGTRYPKSPMRVADDIFFLSDAGFRSITLSQMNENFQDADIGTPIDPLVVPLLTDDIDPISVYYPKLGQFWCIIGTRAFVFTFSRTSKIAAWSEFEFPFPIDAATQLDGNLYLRSGDNVYKVDESAYSDDGTLFEVRVRMPYLNFKAPGVLKYIHGVDAIMKGNATLTLGYDPRDEDVVSAPIPLSGNTAPGPMTPVELTAVQVAPEFTHQGDEDFSLSSLTFYYENLGKM